MAYGIADQGDWSVFTGLIANAQGHSNNTPTIANLQAYTPRTPELMACADVAPAALFTEITAAAVGVAAAKSTLQI
jgi:hypothetical protein